MVRHWRASSPRSWSSSSTTTSGRASSTSQPSQVPNCGRSAIDSAPAACPAAKWSTGRASTRTAPPATSSWTCSGGRVGKTRQSGPSSSGPAWLRARSRRKYGGKEPNPPSSPATKVSSSPAASSGLAARSAPIVVARRPLRDGAAQNEPAPWVGYTASSSGRPSSRSCAPRQRLGLLGGDQVGAGDRADQQRPAAEHGERPATVQQQVGQMLGRVAGGGHRAQREPAEVELLVAVQAVVVEGEPAGPRREDLRAAGGGQLAGAGQEVGVQVGLCRPGDPQASPAGKLQVGGRVAGGVDHQRAPVAQVDQPGRVAEPLVDDRVDVHAGLLGRQGHALLTG